MKETIADLARPFAIYVSSAGASIATVVIAFKVTGFAEAALFIGAVFTGVGALYGARAWENSQVSKHSAEVEIAKAAGLQGSDAAGLDTGYQVTDLHRDLKADNPPLI